jgi:hypothetical protein
MSAETNTAETSVHVHGEEEKCCDGRLASEHRHESPDGKCCVDG